MLSVIQLFLRLYMIRFLNKETRVAMKKDHPIVLKEWSENFVLMKNARKSPYFNAGMDRAKLT